MCKLINEHPEVVLALVQRTLGEPMPDDVELLPAPETIREIQYPEHAVDAAVVLRKVGGAVVEAFVSEVQRQPDADKRWTWPVHVAGTRARLGCPTTLVVITGDERTAQWAAEPIDLGRGCAVLRPVVIGPKQIPNDLDIIAAREFPELATLAVMVHGRKPGSKRIGRPALQAVLEGLDTDEKRYSLLLDLITACLDEQVFQELEAEMEPQITPPFSNFARKHFFDGLTRGEEKGRQEGRQETLRQAIALVLASRGLVLSPAQHERIARCTDPAQLDAWLRRACEVGKGAQLFEPQLPSNVRSAGRSARGGRASKAALASARRSR